MEKEKGTFIKFKTKDLEFEAEGISDESIRLLVTTILPQNGKALNSIYSTPHSATIPQVGIMNTGTVTSTATTIKEEGKYEVKGSPVNLYKMPEVNTSKFPIAELAEDKGFEKLLAEYEKNGYKGQDEKEEEAKPSTEYYRTGIKYTGNDLTRPRFRLGYTCPQCQDEGRHYIPAHVKIVSCHNCNTPLKVEPATPQGIGTTNDFRDMNGNFFIAREEVGS